LFPANPEKRISACPNLYKQQPMLVEITRDLIGAATYADAILDEGIDRYFSANLIGHSFNEDGVTYPSFRLKPT
jgi:hypothetical protein